MKGAITMDKHTLSVKYSLFGKYDYIDATPENVNKLFRAFSPEGFMPNTVNLLKIIQPQNVVEQTLRPQMINNQANCTITFLPERVDIEFSNGVRTDNSIQYIEMVIDLFDLKISRIALNTATLINNITSEELANFNEKLTAPVNYYGETDLIEYSSRRVSRKQIDSIKELINIGRNITGVTESVEGKLLINRIQVDTDINTLAEYSQERFDVNSCRGFFSDATAINEDVISNILVMKDEV